MKITRRDILKLGAGAAASALAGAAQSAAELTTRPIPSSGERLPVVGIGTNRYGTGPEAEIAPLRETLKTFAAAGGKLIDTAPLYRNSELVLGQLIAELGIRKQLFLATKVYTDGRKAGIEEMNASFKRLRTDRIDLIQVHSLSDTTTQLATMREGKAAGRYRYVGVTTSRDSQYDEMEAVLTKEKLDFVQVDYSIENRTAAERILPLALERGVAVLVNLPFGRARLFSAVRGKPLPAWAAEFDCQSWAQFFLKYVIGHLAVTCAIPGTRRPAHVVDNLGAARGRLPDQALRGKMEQFFDAL
ncbi:MAG: aldo/keto reductase [Betaproteobacteria bacterium]|nr:aldo/keto reductase [Betaproteobacteria bacterium]MDH3435786.1 aldo/keto reductase [Betaproteobacteria bacterium]